VVLLASPSVVTDGNWRHLPDGPNVEIMTESRAVNKLDADCTLAAYYAYAKPQEAKIGYYCESWGNHSNSGGRRVPNGAESVEISHKAAVSGMYDAERRNVYRVGMFIYGGCLTSPIVEESRNLKRTMVIGIEGLAQRTKGRGKDALSDFFARRLLEVADDRAVLASGAQVEDLTQMVMYLKESSRDWATYASAAAREKIPGFEVRTHLPESMAGEKTRCFFGGPRVGDPVFPKPRDSHPRWSDEDEGGDDLDVDCSIPLPESKIVPRLPEECEGAITLVLSILGTGTKLRAPVKRESRIGELALCENVCQLVAGLGLDGGGNSKLEERWYRALLQVLDGLNGEVEQCSEQICEKLAAFGTQRPTV
jgi:hypothetical protein